MFLTGILYAMECFEPGIMVYIFSTPILGRESCIILDLVRGFCHLWGGSLGIEV